MKRLKYIVVKHKKENTPEYNEPEEKETNEFWDDPEYSNYREKHGEHFSDKLAVWASKLMKNNQHGEAGHSWTVDEVKAAFEKLGLTKPAQSTWGDVTYSANMAYADYYGISLKTEADCIKQAYADAADPDGYAGKIFNRWLSDVMGKNVKVSWSDFLK